MHHKLVGGKGFRAGVGFGRLKGTGESLNTSHWDPRASLTGRHSHQIVPLEEEAPDFRNVTGRAEPGFDLRGPMVT